MAVLLLSGDLMGASRVEGAVRQVGTAFRMVGSVDAAAQWCAEQPVSLVIVDLATAGVDVSELVSRLTGCGGNAPAIVAYGPHVQEAVLDTAQSAGCDAVFARGQFMGQVAAIITKYAATS